MACSIHQSMHAMHVSAYTKANNISTPRPISTRHINLPSSASSSSIRLIPRNPFIYTHSANTTMGCCFSAPKDDPEEYSPRVRQLRYVAGAPYREEYRRRLDSRQERRSQPRRRRSASHTERALGIELAEQPPVPPPAPRNPPAPPAPPVPPAPLTPPAPQVAPSSRGARSARAERAQDDLVFGGEPQGQFEVRVIEEQGEPAAELPKKKKKSKRVDDFPM